MKHVHMIGMVAVLCGALAHSTVVAAQTPPAAQGFSVVLVLGDLSGGGTAGNVPAAARKALDDMKDFLPYRSYRLLDSGWMLGLGNSWQRLQGLEGQAYELQLSAVAANVARDGKLRVDFELREADTYKTNESRADAEMTAWLRAAVEELKNADLELRGLVERYTEKSPLVVEAMRKHERLRHQIADLQGQNGTLNQRLPGQIINTTFSMDAGETVVVGTSRLRGDKALIALLTAAPRNEKPPAKQK